MGFATATIRSERYPVGTTVGAYLSRQARAGSAPSGAVAATATVQADSSIAFTGLEYRTDYAAYAFVGGEHRYLHFFTTDSPFAGEYPPGGIIDQFLGKRSSVDSDATWLDLPISVVEGVNAITAAGAAQTFVDVDQATINYLTLNAASCTLTFPPLVVGKGFTVVLKQDAVGGRKVTWPVNVAWAAGVTPGLSLDANGVDVFSFLTVDGATWLGFTRSQATTARPYRAAVLTDGPVSYWRLGEASGSLAKDEQGVNNGTYVGGYTLAQAGLLNSEADKAVLFDGASGHVVCKSGAILAGLANWTIEAWIKTSTQKIIYSERGTSGSDIVNMTLSGNKLSLTYRDHAGTLDQVFSTAGPNDNTVHHVAITKQGTAIKFYVDGAAAGTATLTASDTMGEPTIKTWIGGDANDSAGFLTGTIDEVAVYNTALSGARLAAHHDAGIAAP